MLTCQKKPFKMGHKKGHIESAKQIIENYRINGNLGQTRMNNTDSIGEEVNEFLDYDDDNDFNEEPTYGSYENNEIVKAVYKQVLKYGNLMSDEPYELVGWVEETIEWAILCCVMVEKKNAKFVYKQRFYDGYQNTLLKAIGYKLIDTYLLIFEEHELINFNEEHDIFLLLCNKRANIIMEEIGFKFIESKNILGWEVIKNDTEISNIKPVEKIDWIGDQAILAHLFIELENKGVINNKRYLKYLSDHFTINGADINKNSLKTSVTKAKKRAKDYQDKKPLEKQIDNIIIQIPRLIEVLNTIEKNIE